ncbi:DUF3244 domain-containing protein, partial [Bacteroides thetaiotaomicron]|uniref:DUF3244 domain-containing protein n=1 Tax=Bacteroides thetaiotaomicron TaxID=818 RepID=UPI0032C1B6EB
IQNHYSFVRFAIAILFYTGTLSGDYGTTGVPIFRSPNYSPVYICIYGNVLSIDWKKSIGTVFVQILNLDTNEFVLSDDYDAVTGETVEVFIKNAGRYQIMITSELYSGYGDFFVNE